MTVWTGDLRNDSLAAIAGIAEESRGFAEHANTGANSGESAEGLAPAGSDLDLTILIGA